MHSGRMLRQTQNHLANIRRTHHSSPLPEGTHPRLPSPLFAFAHRPLRATPLFTQASQGHPECDIPDLGIATHPYHRLPDLFHLLLISADTTDMLDMYHALNGKVSVWAYLLKSTQACSSRGSHGSARRYRHRHILQAPLLANASIPSTLPSIPPTYPSTNPEANLPIQVLAMPKRAPPGFLVMDCSK